MKVLFTALLFCLTVNASAYDWGHTGHRVTGEIAQQYLNRKARKAIKELLDGESLARVSTYGDEIKSYSEFKEYGPKHYVNIPFNTTYDAHPKSENGDVISAIDTCIAVLQSKTATKAEKAFQLRMLIHFIGDLHQPLHTGIEDDKGGNDFQVRWFKDGTNLHSVWDTKLIEHYGMSYTELASNMPALSRADYKTMAAGTHRDWLADSRVVVKEIYARTKVGEELGYRYMADFKETLFTQLQKGGVRLAALLNNVLG